MLFDRYSRRDREEKAILNALQHTAADQLKKIVAPHRTLWGKTKLALGLTLSPCTTATLELAASQGNIKCIKLVDHGHSPFWRGAALATTARLGSLEMVQWFASHNRGEIADSDYKTALQLLAENGHLVCFKSLRHKWYAIENPEVMLASTAVYRQDEMLRFLVDEFLQTDTKDAVISGALAHLGYTGRWSAMFFIAEQLPELDPVILEKILERFNTQELHRMRAQLDQGKLQASTQDAVGAVCARRI